jgi:hypothetical protein
LAPFSVFRLPIAGHGDEQGLIGLLSDVPGNLVAVHSRQSQVHQHNVWEFGQGRLKRRIVTEPSRVIVASPRRR